jgi:endonuclease/exonuclease/phosphatase (EEP) superfamily protein YafD
VQAPSYVSAKAAPDEVPVRTMSINMLYGRADPVPLVAAAVERADVVMVQELTPEAVAGLTAAGLDKAFPHRILDARPDAQGVGLYSRYPLSSSDRIGGYALAMVQARLHVDGVRRDPTVLSVHLAAPWPQPIGDWNHDLARFPTTLADVAAAADGGAVMVGGDFNATIDMQPFRNLLRDGYRDATEQAGDGRRLTYPANRRIPSFMGIDHVLTRDCTATTTDTLELPGTDHRALFATVMVPRG